MPKLGLVTVLFNSNDVLEGFLKSISSQSFKDYHLYLVDNTPSEVTDHLITELVNKYQIVAYTHIKNTENVGVAKGNNQGIELSLESGSKYTILLNNDIEFEDESLIQQMTEEADLKNENMIIPKILFYDSMKIWMAGGTLLKYQGITKHVGEGEIDHGQFEDVKYFEYAPTCFMLIRNEVFRNVGLMDEKYFVYFDDTDFIYRAVKFGYKVLYLPKFTVLHKVSSSTGGGESLFTIYYGTRNRIYFIRKNLTGFTYFVSLAFTLSTRVIKFIQYDKLRRGKMIKGLFEGLHY